MINSFKGRYRFLSNFHPAKIVYEGIKYPSAEHAFQAAKTEDIELRKHISLLETPVEAKKMGKLLKLRSNWGEIRIDVMRDILRIKFASGGFKDSLLRTGDEELVEGNTWGDKFWGVCDEVGSNWLGKLLMQVRDELR